MLELLSGSGFKPGRRPGLPEGTFGLDVGTEQGSAACIAFLDQLVIDDFSIPDVFRQESVDGGLEVLQFALAKPRACGPEVAPDALWLD